MNDLIAEYAKVNRGLDAYDAQRQEAAAAQVRADAMTAVGRQLAAAANLTKIATEYFVLGFGGASIKWANPRADKQEHSFRAGVEASKVPANRAAVAAFCAQRAYRVQPSSFAG